MSRLGAGWVRASARRVVMITIAVAVALSWARPARADNVDQLISQLEGESVKIRLSAALNLTKLGDSRAILPLAKALGNDGDKNVRSIAAVGLGKLVTAKTKPNLRSLAVGALQRAASGDDSELVKAQAQKSLSALGVSGSSGSSGSSSGGGGGIYVNVGPMSSKTGSGNDPKLRALMQSTAQKTLAKVASSMQTTWPGGGTPTKVQLSQKGFQGFYVDGTLNEVTVTQSGSTATISCKISMLLASFPDRSVFGFLNGGAKVQGSTSASEIAMASDDCVAAVVEDLIAKKIVPTIHSKVSP